jgi:hypothetical protein
MRNSFWRGIPEGTSEALALCVCIALLAITILSVVVVYNVTLNPKDNLKNLCGNVRGLPQGWNCCCVCPATEADLKN